MDALDAPLSQLAFRDAVLAFPLAVLLHVFEEWPCFPRWARRFASPRYSDRAYVVTHLFAVALALVSALVVRSLPLPWVVFAFFALIFGPGVFCNALFHLGASVATRSYCAGALTGLVLYMPLSLLLAALAVREGLMSVPALVAALCVAVVFHTLEVGHNVFARW